MPRSCSGLSLYGKAEPAEMTMMLLFHGNARKVKVLLGAAVLTITIYVLLTLPGNIHRTLITDYPAIFIPRSQGTTISSSSILSNDPALVHAESLIADSFFTDATKELQTIIQNNPGTQLAASAQFKLAEVQCINGNTAIGLSLFQQIAAQYPGTPVGILAQAEVVDLQATNLRQFIPQMSAVIQSAGGIPLDTIIGASNASPASAIEFTLSSTSQDSQALLLGTLYSHVAKVLEGQSNATNDQNIAEEAIKLNHFIREHIHNKNSRENFDVICSIKNIILRQHGITNRTGFPQDKTPPRISSIQPGVGSIIGDKQPLIETDLNDGDITEMQIDTSRLHLFLDNMDITSSLVVTSNIDRSAHIGPGNPFESLSLIYRPPTALASGMHNLSITVPDFAENVLSYTWSFTVR